MSFDCQGEWSYIFLVINICHSYNYAGYTKDLGKTKQSV